jgi:adenylate cyclase
MPRFVRDETTAAISLESIDQVYRDQPGVFPADIEAAFQRAYVQHSLLINRISLASGTVLLATFGALDPYIFAESYREVLAIRFGVLVPMALLIVGCSFAPWYRKVMQPATAVLMLLVLVGILTMSAIGLPTELGTTMYLFGLLPILSFLFVAPRLQFRYAVVVAVIVLVAFEWVLFRENGLLQLGALSKQSAIAVNFILVSEIVIGAMAGFFFERSIRLNFVQQLLIERERGKSEDLLYNMLPGQIVDRLKRKELIADRVESASVCFADFTNFTRLSSTLTPSEILGLLDEAFTQFDRIAAKYGAEKIKTIGDAYMVAVGVPIARADHAEVMARMAMEMRDTFLALPITKKYDLNLRVGFSSGSMVAGVVGSSKRVYDLWGDTVNTASRMESNGIPGEIQLSHYAYDLIKDKFVFESRGEIPIKGKGEMQVYLLRGSLPHEV